MARRKQRIVTPEYLERAALFYLERYSTSAANLKRVLDRKIRRAAQDPEGALDPEQARSWVAAVINKLVRNDLLDDRRFAQSRARRLYSEGKSLSWIRRTLKAKGVGKDALESAMATLAAEADGPVSDLPAAAAYAKRRRLGPFRTDPAVRRAMRQKDLGALARRGFSHAVASAVVNSSDPDHLDQLLSEELE